MSDTHEIDCFAAARRGLELSGDIQPSQLPRLADLLASVDGEVRWRVLGMEVERSGADPDPLFRLKFSAWLNVPCGRCLKSTAISIDSERDYLLVRDENEAVRRDDLESDRDVVVGDRQFRLLSWIEDELILALPPVSYHAQCELSAEAARQFAVPQDEVDGSPSNTQRPFANLAQLRDRSGK